MAAQQTRIGVVAPGSRIDEGIAERVEEIADALYPANAVDLTFHPQCFLSSGHFAGDDAARAQAFLEIANDAGFDALWFARGGYGSCRIAESVMPKLTDAARNKLYLGYSDAGTLLAGLYDKGFPKLAHGPMPGDLVRAGGEAAVERALVYLVVQTGQQGAGIAVAQIELVPGGVGQLRHHALGNPARAVAAAREPQGVEIRVVGDFQKCPRAGRVIAGEMPGREKALRMEGELDGVTGIERRGDRLDPFDDAGVDARARRHHADPGLLCGHGIAPSARPSCQARPAGVVIGG